MSALGPDGGTDFVDPVTAQARGRVGTTLRGKWRLDVLIGVGGMAAVYAGTHRNGSRAAVKILHAELATNSEVRTRFLREGYVANAVAHEGVVKVMDDDTAEDGSLFMCSELLDGETLEERRVRLGGLKWVGSSSVAARFDAESRIRRCTSTPGDPLLGK